MKSNGVLMESTKVCTKCGVEKPLSSFCKHRLSKDGHAYQCKECNNKRARLWRHTPIGLYTNAKGRQNYYHKFGLPGAKPFEITKEWFLAWYETQEKQCVYCSIPEECCKLVTKDFGIHGEQMSIDCKDNELGYVPGNLVLSCHRCNNTKSVLFTYEEMLEIGQKYIRPKWEAIVSRRAKT